MAGCAIATLLGQVTELNEISLCGIERNTQAVIGMKGVREQKRGERGGEEEGRGRGGPDL